MPPLSDCGDGVRRCEQEKRQRGGVGGESEGIPVVLYNKSLFEWQAVKLIVLCTLVQVYQIPVYQL